MERKPEERVLLAVDNVIAELSSENGLEEVRVQGQLVLTEHRLIIFESLAKHVIVPLADIYGEYYREFVFGTPSFMFFVVGRDGPVMGTVELFSNRVLDISIEVVAALLSIRTNWQSFIVPIRVTSMENYAFVTQSSEEIYLTRPLSDCSPLYTKRPPCIPPGAVSGDYELVKTQKRLRKLRRLRDSKRKCPLFCGHSKDYTSFIRGL
mmetsp:Transcript_23095/g.39682  ORF Transcript_23095/g.39682 Transcript_23095/m.39682 type:complete len:208 (-) Transcript_23095:493-1116(-)|eukprot:CAMPEP_0196662830 /NCGR_PEP_ID=MMETSP1086-20130531/50476_1 /TAXON_ID=77921 /ORGANISM="Cyanoptyche  gloeocystis , Strain SAG4.97" /LENGTH=207 /DNA_ID=CAMNT_0041998419 /DNA_START=152 /DNA_END=775 /DNA_ORIENTATION=+